MSWPTAELVAASLKHSVERIAGREIPSRYSRALSRHPPALPTDGYQQPDRPPYRGPQDPFCQPRGVLADGAHEMQRDRRVTWNPTVPQPARRDHHERTRVTGLGYLQGDEATMRVAHHVKRLLDPARGHLEHQ